MRFPKSPLIRAMCGSGIRRCCGALRKTRAIAAIQMKLFQRSVATICLNTNTPSITTHFELIYIYVYICFISNTLQTAHTPCRRASYICAFLNLPALRRVAHKTVYTNVYMIEYANNIHNKQYLVHVYTLLHAGREGGWWREVARGIYYVDASITLFQHTRVQ